jgi:5'-3' exonuclease
MGIKHFFFWFKKQFANNIIKIARGQSYQDVNISVDNFMIDMNGIFHNSAQKIYKYGNCKPPQRLLKNALPPRPVYESKRTQLMLFQDVCDRIEYLFNVVKPNKRFILCIDGTAPLSKQNQQRQRRFRASKESGESKSSDNLFDSNSITPGTKFMDYLSKFIDCFLHNKIQEDENWRNIEIIFSNEKVPGEGEMKCINYIRYYGNPQESYCITALDADLIMLTLGTHMPNIYVLREDLYETNNEFLCVDIGAVRRELTNLLYWEQVENGDGENESKSNFNTVSVINDFFFLCFSVGNDFLPHIPSIEIIENGIELIIEVYREICSEYGHITYSDNGKIKFNPEALGAFFETIGKYEKENFENKLLKKNQFFQDRLLENSAILEEAGWNVDIERYKTSYYETNFPENTSVEKICHSYLEGMQWVLTYYTDGVPNWKWFYPYHYAPFSSSLAEHIRTFQFPNYEPSLPTTPFLQLLCVLPPKSSRLIPEPLSNLLTDASSPLKDFYPDDFEVDLAGKRKEWEGTVILPMINFSHIQREYSKRISGVNPIEQKRNIKGKSFIYTYNDDYSKMYRSYYGNIENCKVQLNAIEL